MFITNNKLINLFKYKRKLSIFLKQFTTNKADNVINNSFNISCNITGKLRILFFGTDQFSLPSFKELHQAYKLNSSACGKLAAVTSFKSPANCVRQYAEQHKIPLQRWPIAAEACTDYDLGVVVSFGHMIPEPLIKAFPLGMINVHASLLPRWRGAAPIIYSIMHADKVTGVSIMRIAPKRFDVGDVLAQRVVDIKQDILMPELHTQLANTGAQLLMEVLTNYPHSFRNAMKQDDSKATYAPKITPDITKIDWCSVTAKDLYNRYRALYGFKCLQTELLDKSVQLVELSLPSTNSNSNLASHSQPGSIIYHRPHKSLLVCCADNAFIEVHKLRVEGKKIMSAMEFNNGFLRKLNNQQLLFLNKCTG